MFTALQVIIAIADNPGTRSSWIQEELGISRPSFTRALAEARRLGVVISYSHENGYQIESGNVKLTRKWLELNEQEEPLA